MASDRVDVSLNFVPNFPNPPKDFKLGTLSINNTASSVSFSHSSMTLTFKGFIALFIAPHHGQKIGDLLFTSFEGDS